MCVTISQCCFSSQTRPPTIANCTQCRTKTLLTSCWEPFGSFWLKLADYIYDSFAGGFSLEVHVMWVLHNHCRPRTTYHKFRCKNTFVQLAIYMNIIDNGNLSTVTNSRQVLLIRYTGVVQFTSYLEVLEANGMVCRNHSLPLYLLALSFLLAT